MLSITQLDAQGGLEMYYACECGNNFPEMTWWESAKKHVAELHRDLVEARFEELLDEDEDDDDELFEDTKGEDQLYEEAIEEVTNELMYVMYDDEL
jgi:hypothetical protein